MQIWMVLFWVYMASMIGGMYHRGGAVMGVYALISVVVIYLWFRKVGFFDKTS